MEPPGSSRAIDVVSAADAAYALPLAVMLRSLGDALGDGMELSLHVIDDGLGEPLRERVQASVPDRTIRWIEPAGGHEDGLPLWGRMPATTYHKLALPELLPSCARVLWLDADLVALDDVGALWDTPLDGRAAAAVRDPFVDRLDHRLGVAAWRELGLPPSAPYFNAGVLLIDLERWRREEVGRRAHDYLHRFADRVFFHDQEALNAVLVDDWTAVADRWNRSVNAERLGMDRDGPPAILHYSGTLKPWVHRAGSRLHRLYYEHLDQTAWKGFRPDPSLSARLLDLYQRSPVRPLLQPLEQLWFRRWVERTRRSTGPRPASAPR